MKQKGSKTDESMVGLVASFVGINVMLAGLFVVLAPHMVVCRLRRAWRAHSLARAARRTPDSSSSWQSEMDQV